MQRHAMFCFIFLYLLSLPTYAIGLAVSNNNCDSLRLSSNDISSAGQYFATSKECSATLHIAGIDATTPWTLSAKISALNTGLPVKIALNSGSFHYLSQSTEIILTTGTGVTSSHGLDVTLRIDHIDAQDGHGDLIDHANVIYRVVTN